MRFLHLVSRVKDIIYGMFILDPILTVVKMRHDIDILMILTLYSDIMGVPIMAPIYKLNLLPYFYPQFDKLKKNILREHDITEKIKE